MTMRLVSDDPRLRLFDGHADIAGAHHSRMMRTALRRKGRRESDEAYPPSAEKVSCSVIDHAACRPTHRLWERSRWSMGVSL